MENNTNDMILIPREELNNVKKQMSMFKDMIQHLNQCVSGLKQAIEENNRNSFSNDSGMLSGTVLKRQRERPNLTLADLADAAAMRIAAIEAGTETLIDEMRPEKPLLYGIIRHNPNKVQKTSDQTEETAKEEQASDVENTDSHSNETSTRQPPVNDDPEWEAPSVLHEKKKEVQKRASNSKSGASQKMIPIGTGKTMVPKEVYAKINWESYTIATRKLLIAVFSRKTLATHSLTGKPSPAFANKPAKSILDQKKVNDIMLTVAQKCKVKESLVRNAITTKCADENKMLRMRQKRNQTV